MVLHQVEEQIGLTENTTTSLVQWVQLVLRFLLALKYYYIFFRLQHQQVFELRQINLQLKQLF